MRETALALTRLPKWGNLKDRTIKMLTTACSLFCKNVPNVATIKQLLLQMGAKCQDLALCFYLNCIYSIGWVYTINWSHRLTQVDELNSPDTATAKKVELKRWYPQMYTQSFALLSPHLPEQLHLSLITILDISDVAMRFKLRSQNWNFSCVRNC